MRRPASSIPTGLRLRFALWPVCLLAGSVALLLAASAAIGATRNITVGTTQGRPGIQVSVGIVDSGPHMPNRELVVYRLDSPHEDCIPAGPVYVVGTITWIGGVGTGTFVVPSVPAGSYLVEERMPEYQPPCMPVTPFTVLDPNLVPNTSMPPQSTRLGLYLAGIAMLGIAGLLRVRRTNST